jgi:hypothetical protein
LAGPEQGRGLGGADLERKLLGDDNADRLGQPRRFVQARGRGPAGAGAKLGKDYDCAGASANLCFTASIENAQAPDSSSSPSIKLTGRSGCTVEMACL